MCVCVLVHICTFLHVFVCSVSLYARQPVRRVSHGNSIWCTPSGPHRIVQHVCAEYVVQYVYGWPGVTVHILKHRVVK